MAANISFAECLDKNTLCYDTDIDDGFCKISKNVLNLAAQLNIFPENSVKDEFFDEDVELTKEFINIWKLIESERKELHRVKFLIHQDELLIENSYIMNPQIHMKRLQEFHEINEHFTIIIKETEKLRNRLQSPLLSEAINIHYSYQNNILQFFELISSHFKKFEFHLNILNKGTNLNYEELKKDCGELLETTKKRIAELQMSLHSLLTFRSSLNKLQQLKSKEFSKSNISNTTL